uniref:Evasin P1095 n=1 Tax=Ixodes ricinus TaxID=34613 RepID=E1095_IXORI|nr:RecName: Full=Evasin P1095; Flags: Precursor [Ixodes ricinus]
MELNAFTILQIAVFIAVGYHANTHSPVAGSEVQKLTSDPNDDIDVSYCGMNCTVVNGKSDECSENCKCLHEGDDPKGICVAITYFGDWGDPNDDPKINEATPQTQIFEKKRK